MVLPGASQLKLLLTLACFDSARMSLLRNIARRTFGIGSAVAMVYVMLLTLLVAVCHYCLS